MSSSAELREHGLAIGRVFRGPAICDLLSGGAAAIEDGPGAPFVALTTIDEIYPKRLDREG